MTKEEAIKYLQQLYPNGGHCWLDEQRIEAIGMAVKALQEEPVNKDLGKENKIEILADIIFNAAKHGYMPYDTQDENCAMEIAKRYIDKFIATKKQENPVSEDLEKIVEEIAEPTILNAYGTKELARRLRNTICGTSVSDDLEKAANDWNEKASFNPFYMVMNGDKPIDVKQDITTHADSFKAGAKWQKTKDESTTEDLGEYINELSKQFPDVSFAKLSRIAVRVAKWQKQQDQSTIELAEDHAMLAGMEKMKEEMMTKSIEAVVSQVPCSNEIILYNPSSVYKYSLPQEMNKLGLNKGDKVKVIVIKED